MDSKEWRETLRMFGEREFAPDSEEEFSLLYDMAQEAVEEKLPEVALKIWRAMADTDSEWGDLAKAAHAEYLFEIGEDDAAKAQLSSIKAAGRTAGNAWTFTAEVLDGRGEINEALEWYDAIAEGMSPGDLTYLIETSDWEGELGRAVRWRRGIRAQLGHPLDPTDRLLPSEEDIREIERRESRIVQGSVGQLLDERGRPGEVRTLFWPRGEYDAMLARWPGIVEAPDADTYYRSLEQNMRQISAPRAGFIPAEVDDMADFLARIDRPMSDPDARQRYLEMRYEQDHYVAWPPERNRPCWCGSGAKYKK